MVALFFVSSNAPRLSSSDDYLISWLEGEIGRDVEFIIIRGDTRWRFRPGRMFIKTSLEYLLPSFRHIFSIKSSQSFSKIVWVNSFGWEKPAKLKKSRNAPILFVLKNTIKLCRRSLFNESTFLFHLALPLIHCRKSVFLRPDTWALYFRTDSHIAAKCHSVEVWPRIPSTHNHGQHVTGDTKTLCKWIRN